MKTVSVKEEEVPIRWYVVDAEGKILGRLASRVASILRGKHKPTFTPHVAAGDHVIVVNASKIRLTGDKLKKKVYSYHSGYPGGLKSFTAHELLEKRPERMILLAVRGMLPKNKLGRQMLKKLKVYRSPSHPHQAQQPESLPIPEAHRDNSH